MRYKNKLFKIYTIIITNYDRYENLAASAPIWNDPGKTLVERVALHLDLKGSIRPYGTLRAGDFEGSDVEPTTLRADDFEGRRL